MISEAELRAAGAVPRESVFRESVSDQARPGRTALIGRVSWSAVLAGVAVGIGCQLMLSTLGAAIGLALIEPSAGARADEGIAIGAGIWWLVSGLVSLGVGGAVAGRLAGFPHPIDASLNGLLVWGVASVLGVLAVTITPGGLATGMAGPIVGELNRNIGIDEDRGARDATGLGAIGREAIGRADRAAEGTLPADRAGARDAERTPTRDADRRAAAATDPDEKDAAADALAAAAVWSFFGLLMGAMVAGTCGYFARPPAVIGADPALV